VHERDVALADHTGFQHGFPRKLAQLIPEIEAHSYDREALQLAGLDERRDLESLIKRAEPARHDDEGGRVLDEHHLANEEMLHLDELVQVRVRFLLLGEVDVAAYAQAAGLLGAPIRRLHDARAAAGHDRIAGVGERRAQVTGHAVVLMALVEAGGAEHGDAGLLEVEAFEAPQELEEDLYGAFEIGLATTSPRQEQFFGTFDLVEQGRATLSFLGHGNCSIASPEKNVLRQLLPGNSAKDLSVIAMSLALRPASTHSTQDSRARVTGAESRSSPSAVGKSSAILTLSA
jgi:hypothetical protein